MPFVCFRRNITDVTIRRIPKEMLKEFKVSSFASNCSANVSFFPFFAQNRRERNGSAGEGRKNSNKENIPQKVNDVCPPKLNFLLLLGILILLFLLKARSVYIAQRRQENLIAMFRA